MKKAWIGALAVMMLMSGIGCSVMKAFASPQDAHIGVWVMDVTYRNISPCENRVEQVLITRSDGTYTVQLIGQGVISRPSYMVVSVNAIFSIEGNTRTNTLPDGRIFTLEFEITGDVLTDHFRRPDGSVVTTEWTRVQNPLVGLWVNNNPVTGETVVNFLSDGTYVQYTNRQVISGSYSIEGNRLTVRAGGLITTVDLEEIQKDEFIWPCQVTGLTLIYTRY